MKIIIKNNLKLFIGVFIGLIISGITVYAINANQIDYKDGKTVREALDDLYDLKEINFDSSDISYDYNSGKQTTTMTGSISLNKGRYLIFTVFNFAAAANIGELINENQTHDGTAWHGTLACNSNNCVINELKGGDYVIQGNYTFLRLIPGIFVVEIKGQTDTLTYTTVNANANANNPWLTQLYAISLDD